MKIKRAGKIFLKFLQFFIVLGIIGGMFSMLINSYVKSMAEGKMISFEELSERKEKYDAVIILGSKVYSDSVVSGILRDRLLVGYEVYRNGNADKIIVSGDHGREDYDEVVAMKRFLIEQGVPREDIYMDHAGFDTYDSLYRAKNIFCVESAVVVTQEYHLYRAVYIGRSLGLDILGVSSDLSNYSRMGYNLVREFFARNKAFLDTDIFRRKAKILGEKISIFENNGLVTEDEKAKEIFDSMQK